MAPTVETGKALPPSAVAVAAVDTNVLVRLLVKDDPGQYDEAARFVGANPPVFVSHLSILELVWVLTTAYGKTKEQVAAALQALLDAGEVAVESPSVVQGAIGHWKASKAAFADCLILTVAEAAGQIPLATFDRVLGRLPGTLLLGRRGRSS